MKKLIMMFFTTVFLVSVGLPACANREDKFLQATREGEMEIIEDLVTKVKAEVKEKALCLSIVSTEVEGRHWDVANFLLDNGTNPNIRCRGYEDYEDGWTFLMGVMNGTFPPGCRGCPIELSTSEIPLRKEALRKALKNGVNVDEKILVGKQEYTALTFAIEYAFEYGKFEMIKILVQEGNPDLSLTCNGETPIEVATRYHETEIIAFLEEEMQKQQENN